MDSSNPTPRRDPAVQDLITQVEGEAESFRILDGLDLQMSPELTRLLERGLIGPGSPVQSHSKKAARAFQKTFEEIGGVERLSLWADKNPGRFYGMYSKLVPTTAEITEKRDIQVTIKWASPDRLSYQNKPPSGPPSDGEVVDVPNT
jgi:hypothetical protein